MKKKIEKKDNRSLKTFFIYTFIVLFSIIVSLGAKAISVLRESKFDGKDINIAITQNNHVTSVLGFNTNNNSISLLKIKNSNIPISSVSKKTGIIVEGKINSDNDSANIDPEAILKSALLRNRPVKTDLTIFDLARLIIFSKNVPEKNRQTHEIGPTSKEHDIDKIVSVLFKDEIISTENVSIEIINATDEPGLGKRLERCLTNIGANVVAVSTPRVKEKSSKIQYFAEKSYTLQKLNKILNFPTEKIDRKTIAKIVIIIGEDDRSASRF